MAKLIPARNASQSLDDVILKGTCDVLEAECFELNLSLQGFDLGSTFQTAFEILVVNTSEVEEEEDEILGEISKEAQRLEMLELEVELFHLHHNACG